MPAMDRTIRLDGEPFGGKAAVIPLQARRKRQPDGPDALRLVGNNDGGAIRRVLFLMLGRAFLLRRHQGLFLGFLGAVS